MSQQRLLVFFALLRDKILHLMLISSLVRPACSSGKEADLI